MAKSVVRQMRGPGMNKGLKKPRHGSFSGPEKVSTKSRTAAGPRDNNYKKPEIRTLISENLWDRST